MSLYHRPRHNKYNKTSLALESSVRSYLWTNPTRRRQKNRTGLFKPLRGILSVLGALFQRFLINTAVLIILASVILITSVVGGGTYLFSSLIYDVTLCMDTRTVATRCLGGTVGDLLERYSIELAPGDSIDPPLDTPVFNGMEITMRTAQTVYIWDANSSAKMVKLVSGTVKDAISQAGITLCEDDRISPDVDTMIHEGLEVVITRVEYEYESVIVEIPFNTITKKTSELPLGETKVSEEGQTGENKKLVQKTLENGELITSRVINDEVLEKPKDKVILSGTYVAPTPAPVQTLAATAPPTSTQAKTSTTKSTTKETVKSNAKTSGGVITVNGKSVNYKSVHNGKATAYTHTGRNTATGTKPAVGTVAVDPKVIPLGSRLYIPGYGFARAEDTGDSVIRNYTVDLFFETRDECIQWGVRAIKIYILD